jgi:hypothetical protein
MNSNVVESVVRAAVLGLLAASQSACSGSDRGEPDRTASTENELGAAQSDGSENASTASGSTGNTEGVTSRRTVPDLGLEEFTQMCDEADGVVEVHASCGGLVSGRGFSYDSDTDHLIEHTCRGFNTCKGFSCVLDA